MKLELGVGSVPTPGYLRHDRTYHSDYIDVAHDLEVFPWPWTDGQFDEVRAFDVMEHLRLEVWEWLGEAWRIIAPDGVFVFRLPAWDNPLSYRDITHHRLPFHPESFDYFDPDQDLWKEFGRYYPGSETNRWWKVESVSRENGNSYDWVYTLRKR